jgi:hypothetical protein
VGLDPAVQSLGAHPEAAGGGGDIAPFLLEDLGESVRIPVATRGDQAQGQGDGGELGQGNSAGQDREQIRQESACVHEIEEA